MLLGLAFALRLYELDAVPLRGDEAFAVRYWADSPIETVRLAKEEPHPLGTFLSFWVWKKIAGDSEFAMRYFPLLGNLVGVASLAALGKRLFRTSNIALLGAAFWAVNPFQIWHSQDVRNYAIWAGLSPLAMWLFVRAADTDRRHDWTLYLVAELAALYVFFLEGLLLFVHGLYILILRRSRKTIRHAAVVWALLGLLLIPWLGQLWFLAHSGYEGNLERSNPGRLLTWFLPVLLTGDTFKAPWEIILPLVWCLLIAVALIWSGRVARLHLWLVLWIVVPAGLLLVAATRMSVFHPRYLIALTPALLLLMVSALGSLPQQRASRLIQFGLLVTRIIGFSTLYSYYQGENPKSPDWPALAADLASRTGEKELILRAFPDPAFNYYYDGAAKENSIIPGVSISAQLAPEINYFDAIWLVGQSPETETYLNERLQNLGTYTLAGFTITQYRKWEISPPEITQKADVRFGDMVRLIGFTVQGGGTPDTPITVLLYWDPLLQAEIDYKVFVHLIGPPHPESGSPLWDQDDHQPRFGFASTTTWEPGALIRDPYHLLARPNPELPQGTYTLQVGFYDPETNTRLPVTDTDGTDVGDSYPLQVFDWSH